MINYEQLENDVVARIGTISGVLVDLQPDTDAKANDMRPVQQTRVFVYYHSSPFPQAELNSRPEGMTTDVAIQEEYPRIVVSIRSNRRRGVGGLYDVIAKVKAKLIGFQPPYATTKFFISKIEHAERDGGVWEHNLVWSFTTMLLEDVPAPTGEPWKTVTFEESDGDKTVIENPNNPPE